MSSSRRLVLRAFSLAAATLAAMQPALADGPAAATKRGPPEYASSVAGHRQFRDEPVADWRASNDLAASLGGWKAFASGRHDAPEAAKPAPPPAKGEGPSPRREPGATHRHGAPR